MSLPEKASSSVWKPRCVEKIELFVARFTYSYSYSLDLAKQGGKAVTLSRGCKKHAVLHDVPVVSRAQQSYSWCCCTSKFEGGKRRQHRQANTGIVR